MSRKFPTDSGNLTFDSLTVGNGGIETSGDLDITDGILYFTRNGIGETNVTVQVFENNEDSTASVDQYSPTMMWRGTHWDYDNNASRPVELRMYFQTRTDRYAGAIAGNLMMDYRYDNGNWFNVFRQAGTFTEFYQASCYQVLASSFFGPVNGTFRFQSRELSQAGKILMRFRPQNRDFDFSDRYLAAFYSDNEVTWKWGLFGDGAQRWIADITTDTAPNDDTTLKRLSLQKLPAPPTNAAYIQFSNNPGTDNFYLVLEEG